MVNVYGKMQYPAVQPLLDKLITPIQNIANATCNVFTATVVTEIRHDAILIGHDAIHACVNTFNKTEEEQERDHETLKSKEVPFGRGLINTMLK